MDAHLTGQGSALLQYLRGLFGGNHVQPNDIAPTSEKTDRYLATASVIWRFEPQTTETTKKGNAAVAGRHFDYRAADFQARLQNLCAQAISNRDIRGPFMQKVDLAGADALAWSSEPRVAHDFGSYSVFRQCGSCRGSGRVSCGGCGGGGRRTCYGCGGVGSQNHHETRTRWNGRHNETYTQMVRRSCGSCGGGGRVVCTSCGGSGKQTCGACSGHGFFTDIAQVQAIAKPHWHVPAHSGLASEALVRALKWRGPSRSRELVPFKLSGTAYNDQDHWVARYEGLAEVVELGLLVVKSPYSVAAVGSNVIPIITPAVFDELLHRELEQIKRLSIGRRSQRQLRRQAKDLFSQFRSLPVLDRCLQGVAKQKGDERSAPEAAIANAAHGFISPDASKALGLAIQAVLDKVSPANSILAWMLVGLPVVFASFALTANEFNRVHGASIWNIAFTLGAMTLLSAGSMLSVSPVGWALSTIVSSLMRLRVPKEYRQRGRNWAPLKGACLTACSASVIGAAYGGASANQWVPSVKEALAPAATYAMAHLEPGSVASRYVAMVAPSDPVAVAPVSDVDTYREIQRHLIMGGYLRGAIDGTPGPATRAAIARYKRDKRLIQSISAQELLTYMKQH